MRRIAPFLSLLFVPVLHAASASYSVRMLPLPHGDQNGIYMDYIAYDPATGYVWVPAGNTGSIDMVDTATGKVKQIGGQGTKEVEMRGRKRILGPTSVTVGKDYVYIGNRADFSICAFNARNSDSGPCHRIDSMPDGLAYVASTSEVWVTAPRDKTIRILDAATLAEKEKITFEGNPEGFAVDEKRGRFYTNLEDKDRTLAIDLKSRKTVATWNPACGPDGPHGIRVDEKAGFLFVACSAQAKVLDVGRGGSVLSSIATGDGVDDLDYAPSSHLLYLGAAKTGDLTIARAGKSGHLTLVARVPTHEGARNGVVTKDGTVYLAHSMLGDLNDLVVVSPQSK